MHYTRRLVYYIYLLNFMRLTLGTGMDTLNKEIYGFRHAIFFLDPLEKNLWIFAKTLDQHWVLLNIFIDWTRSLILKQILVYYSKYRCKTGCVPRKHQVCRSVSVLPICNPEHVFRICNMINFGIDWWRMDQDLPCSYDGQFCIQLTAPQYYSKYLWRATIWLSRHFLQNSLQEI